MPIVYANGSSFPSKVYEVLPSLAVCLRDAHQSSKSKSRDDSTSGQVTETDTTALTRWEHAGVKDKDENREQKGKTPVSSSRAPNPS